MRTLLLLAALLFPACAFGQASFSVLPSPTDITEIVGVPYDVDFDLTINTAPSSTLDGIEFGALMPLAAGTQFASMELGSVLQALNGGSGPDFVDVSLHDFGPVTPVGSDNLLSIIVLSDLPLSPSSYKLFTVTFVNANVSSSFMTLDRSRVPTPGPPAIENLALYDTTLTEPTVPFGGRSSSSPASRTRSSSGGTPTSTYR